MAIRTWDQQWHEERKAALSPERRAADEATLQEIFKRADDIPLLAEALSWARLHGMQFFIDDESSNKRKGEYQSGTGILNISPEIVRDPVNAAGTIVHEVRHAWQDFHGLMPRRFAANFTENFLRRGLLEADAAAFGDRARDQGRAAQMIKAGEALPEELQDTLSDASFDLADKFLHWFFKSWAPKIYGDKELKIYTKRYESADQNPKKTASARAGIGTANIADLMRLGKGFADEPNYMTRVPRDVLLRDIMPSSLVNTFWGAAENSEQQKKQLEDVRKAALCQKLDTARKQPRPRHPLP